MYSADGGSAATVAVGYYYNPTNQTGFEGVYSSAQGDPGVATASLGDSESVLLTNTGTATDVVDVVSFLQSMVTYVQPSLGYAVTLTTTAGMYIGTNYGTPNANLSEIYVQYTGNTGPGNPTGYNNFLTNVGYNALTAPPIVYAAAFDASLTLSIAPGETDFLSGFAESKNMVTPEPSAAMVLGAGVLGLGLLKRRKRL